MFGEHRGALSFCLGAHARALLKTFSVSGDIMETRVALEADFIELLARLMSETDEGEPPFERTGRDLPCSQPGLGRWIDDCDVPFLLETLALPDDVFAREFPGIKLSQRDREAFARTLDTHCTECAHCGAKNAEDIAWKLRVDKAFVENKQAIGHFLTGATRKP
jgi:hypothetical protein